MATTVNEVSSHAAGGLNFLHLKLTAGGADSSVTYTIAGKPTLLGCTAAIKTTGSIAAQGITYVESTGVLTIGCSASDVVRVTLVH